jgi:uncharacterized protein (DUF1501 family)
MKRRDFIQKVMASTALPLVLNGFPIESIASNSIFEQLGKTGFEDRILVIIQLNGGNDGLNTVIPLDQYDNLFNARKNIIIPSNKILALTGTASIGLHPSLIEMRNLYDNGKINIIQNVGLPDPNFSHFRATDIWLTGSDNETTEPTGWAGRFLEKKYVNFPTDYPNLNYPDPPAIQIGPYISPAFQGKNITFGMPISDPKAYYQFVNGTVDTAPNTPAGHELTYLRLVKQQTEKYRGSIKSAAERATNLSTLYPSTGSNTLADQLKIVAQLIGGGLKTQIYMVSMGGFDTHALQTDSSNPELGNHAVLLQKVSQAINAFQDDIEKMGADFKVMGMTFSEFGRRIKSNDSQGTDHGAAAPLFIFGKNVKPGITGSNPIIPANVTVSDNVTTQIDFRSVYASILKYWFDINDNDIDPLLLNKSFPLLDIIDSKKTGVNNPIKAKIGFMENFPNPANTQTTIRFSCSKGLVKIVLFDSNWREILTVVEAHYDKGTHEVLFSTTLLNNGTYYYKFEQGNDKLVKQLIVVKY